MRQLGQCTSNLQKHKGNVQSLRTFRAPTSTPFPSICASRYAQSGPTVMKVGRSDSPYPHDGGSDGTGWSFCSTNRSDTAGLLDLDVLQPLGEGETSPSHVLVLV